jgi:hypothetical protein
MLILKTSSKITNNQPDSQHEKQLTEFKFQIKFSGDRHKTLKEQEIIIIS